MGRSRRQGDERVVPKPEVGAQAVTGDAVSPAGFMLRLFWMGFGSLVLLYLVGSIARLPAWSFTWRDVALVLTVLASIGARYVEVAKYEGLTVNSEPATQQHVRRYAAGLSVVALLLWLGAQSVAT